MRDKHGRTIAAAHGRPPWHAPGIHGAELWALLQCAMSSVAAAPFFVDCKSVYLGAQRSMAWARASERRLARLWAPLAQATDDRRRAVHWMPAHCGLDEAGTRDTSAGRKLTQQDILANREVDKFAKDAAEADRLPRWQVERVMGHWMEVEAIAKWIGVVSAQAQRHDAESDPAGRGAKRRRDTSEALVCRRRERWQGAGADPQREEDALEEAPRQHLQRWRACARQRRQQAEADEARSVAQWLADRRPGQPAKRDASVVLEEVARRVRARLAQAP